MHGKNTSFTRAKKHRLSRAAAMSLTAASLPLLTFCSVFDTDKAPEKLTVPVASFGLHNLKSSYAKTLKSGNYNDLKKLYTGVDFSKRSRWQLPLVSNSQGIQVRYTEATSLTEPQLAGLLSNMSTKLGNRDRAQIWFRKLDMKDELNAHVELWIEANGTNAGKRSSFRGVWHWDVARSSTSAPWKITKHDLGEWAEATSQRTLFREISRGIGVKMKREFHDSETSPFMAGIESSNLGSGVTLTDIDGDGDLDIYLPNGAKNRMFINNGSGNYREVAASRGAAHPGLGHSALIADFTGDGRKDIYIVNTRQYNTLLINRGGNRFKEAPNANGAAGKLETDTSACVADIDLDGDLDLVVGAYLLPSKEWKMDSGALQNGARNSLYINDGAGNFTDETAKRGLARFKTLTLVCSFGDFDNDGDPDLLIGNDFSRDHLFVNDGTGHFSEQGKRRGIKDRGFSMSASWCDIDNDGDLDMHITKMTSGTTWMFDDPRFPFTGLQRLFRPLVIRELKKMTAGNSIFINQGDGTFRDAAKETRLDVAHWAFSGVPIDFDLDGDLDFYTVNGFISGKDEEDT